MTKTLRLLIEKVERKTRDQTASATSPCSSQALQITQLDSVNSMAGVLPLRPAHLPNLRLFVSPDVPPSDRQAGAFVEPSCSSICTPILVPLLKSASLSSPLPRILYSASFQYPDRSSMLSGLVAL